MSLSPTKKRAIRDGIWLLAIGFAAYIAGVYFDVADTVMEFAEAHEDYEIDELILALLLLGLFGFIYAYRRTIDLRGEVRRRRRAEADTTWTAQHDLLTRLPNRRFLDKFASDLTNGSSPPARHVVFALDLDGFKKVNDLIGHHGGNDLLVATADRLQNLFRDDLVFRLGGDEFTVIAKSEAAADSLAAGQRIVDALQQPLTINGVGVQVGASVGIAIIPEQTADLHEALRLADIALYAAKRRGRGSVVMFEQSMDDALAQRMAAEASLRAAIQNREIVPNYQPLVDLATGTLRGFEALARWRSAEGHFVPPDVFIELAEDAGLITILSEQLLAQACADAMTWPSHLVLAFNISPTQLTDPLLGLRIVQIIGQAGLSPTRLEVEITESALVRDLDAALAVVDSLHQAGIRVALDDFGTGYSSLAQLSRLKFDKVKIDRSFVASFEGDEKQEKIVKAIIGLGHGLGIATTAEGIEEEEQWERLRQMGCDFGQGFLFGKALPPEAAKQLIDAQKGQKAQSPAA